MNRRHRTISTEEKERFIVSVLPLRHRLVQFARAVTDDEEEAQDLVGDTVLAALESFHRLNDQQAILSWLFTIASRLQRRKRERRKRFQRFDKTTNPDLLPSHSASPDTGPDIEALYRGLRELPELQREAVVLYEISRLSLEEIRAIQGGSISAVKMRLARGRKALAELLGIKENLVAAETGHYLIKE